MTQCVEPSDTNCNRESDAHMYETVYMIKRPGYEFVFSVPTAQTADITALPPRFQLRFRTPPQEREIVLDLEALEEFYESLSRLMEYVNTERQKFPQS
jgi:hypothetical protein